MVVRISVARSAKKSGIIGKLHHHDIIQQKVTLL